MTRGEKINEIVPLMKAGKLPQGKKTKTFFFFFFTVWELLFFLSSLF